jgi:excisionase family DNA binding protein
MNNRRQTAPPHLPNARERRRAEARGVSDAALLTRLEAAGYLQVGVDYLAQLAHRGQGPPMVKLGRNLVRYRRGDLDAWVEGHIVGGSAAER